MSKGAEKGVRDKLSSTFLRFIDASAAAEKEEEEEEEEKEEEEERIPDFRSSSRAASASASWDAARRAQRRAIAARHRSWACAVAEEQKCAIKLMSVVAVFSRLAAAE